jgi:hypothetical protein
MARLDESVFHVMRQALQEHAARWQSAAPGLTKPQFAVLVALAEVDESAAIERRRWRTCSPASNSAG